MSPVRLPSAALGQRFFPEPDAITIEEYRRLTPPHPAALRPPPKQRRIECAHCGVHFTPHRLAASPRFCSGRCRRRFHARLSMMRRKARAA